MIGGGELFHTKIFLQEHVKQKEIMTIFLGDRLL